MKPYRTSIVNAKIQPTLKIKAIKIPNKTTQKAMHDAELGKTKKTKNVDALFKKLKAHPKKGNL
jgi:hypothetical protein